MATDKRQVGRAMKTISTHDIDLTLTVAGVKCELSATVRYEWLDAERGSRERGGLQLEPDYPAGPAIISVILGSHDITHRLNKAQLDALAAEIAEGGA